MYDLFQQKFLVRWLKIGSQLIFTIPLRLCKNLSRNFSKFRGTFFISFKKLLFDARACICYKFKENLLLSYCNILTPAIVVIIFHIFNKVYLKKEQVQLQWTLEIQKSQTLGKMSILTKNYCITARMQKICSIH